MNQSPFVHPSKSARDTDGKAQAQWNFQWAWKKSIESFTARVLEFERHLPSLLGKCNGPNRPGRVQFIP
ncbi:MAG TPA: hypothetical protein VGF61_12775, partial [Candidatus Acidoferrum sp.]